MVFCAACGCHDNKPSAGAAGTPGGVTKKTGDVIKTVSGVVTKLQNAQLGASQTAQQVGAATKSAAQKAAEAAQKGAKTVSKTQMQKQEFQQALKNAKSVPQLKALLTNDKYTAAQKATVKETIAKLQKPDKPKAGENTTVSKKKQTQTQTQTQSQTEKTGDKPQDNKKPDDKKPEGESSSTSKLETVKSHVMTHPKKYAGLAAAVGLSLVLGVCYYLEYVDGSWLSTLEYVDGSWLSTLSSKWTADGSTWASAKDWIQGTTRPQQVGIVSFAAAQTGLFGLKRFIPEWVKDKMPNFGSGINMALYSVAVLAPTVVSLLLPGDYKGGLYETVGTVLHCLLVAYATLVNTKFVSGSWTLNTLFAGFVSSLAVFPQFFALEKAGEFASDASTLTKYVTGQPLFILGLWLILTLITAFKLINVKITKADTGFKKQLKKWGPVVATSLVSVGICCYNDETLTASSQGLIVALASLCFMRAFNGVSFSKKAIEGRAADVTQYGLFALSLVLSAGKTLYTSWETPATELKDNENATFFSNTTNAVSKTFSENWMLDAIFAVPFVLFFVSWAWGKIKNASCKGEKAGDAEKTNDIENPAPATA